MDIDRPSYCLGMVFAFAEVVASGVKPLALSPPLDPSELEPLRSEVAAIGAQFGVLVREDMEVLATRLFDPAFTAGKAVFLLAADEAVLRDYAALKSERSRLGGSGSEAAEVALARRFGRLLGYSAEVIDDLLAHPRFAGGDAGIPGA